MSTNELVRLEVVRKIVDKQVTQVLAAQQLGLTVRQVKRLVKRYRQTGVEGLVSKQRFPPKSANSLNYINFIQ